jgi:hypothetical protein
VGSTAAVGAGLAAAAPVLLWGTSLHNSGCGQLSGAVVLFHQVRSWLMGMHRAAQIAAWAQQLTGACRQTWWLPGSVNAASQQHLAKPLQLGSCVCVSRCSSPIPLGESAHHKSSSSNSSAPLKLVLNTTASWACFQCVCCLLLNC